MYLSKLELHGFKSFAEQTELQFAPGVTAIVGPNGCGKSNIVDAVRWAIGEQRPTALRSEKMENVIFNGTAQRRALGMAEVQLTIENNRGVLPTEYSEVTIGRRLFRDGTSEYLMNGTRCRLKDITDLFMDTGMGADAYSVIELKMVDEILSDSAEDRRRLFEEAAGITRYKKRRRQALRKLDNTQSDLTRIRDLTDEIGKKVRRLKRQAEKASEHKRCETRLHDLELKLARAEYQRLTDQRQTLETGLEKLQDRTETLTNAQQRQEDQLAALRRQLAGREETLNERRAAMQEHRERVRSLEADQRLEQERLSSARRDRERLEREQEEAQQQREELQARQEDLHEALEEARPVRQEAEATLKETREERDRMRERVEAQRERLQALRREEEEAETTRTEHQRTLDRCLSRVELLEQERERAHEELDVLSEERETLETRLDRAETAFNEAQEAVAEARTALEEARRKREERQDLLEAATAELREIERRRDALNAEVQLLESLVSSYEEFSDAVRSLAEAPEHWSEGDLRTVADVMTCADEGRLALDAALGDLAACVVVRSEAEAQRAIEHLRTTGEGQATFLILERLSKTSAPTEAANETARPLQEVIRVTDPAYERLADTLLRDKYLAGSLEDARALAAASEHAAFYTRSGEWIDSRGLLRGGSQPQGPSPATNRLGRREQLERAQKELSDLEVAYEEQQATVEEHERALTALSVDEYQHALRQAEKQQSEAEKALERLRYERSALTDRREAFEDRLASLEKELETRRTEARRLEKKAQETETERLDRRSEREAVEETFASLEAAYHEALNRYNEANVTAVEARNRLENLKRDLERTRERLEEMAVRAERRRKELQTLQETIETARERQAELQDDIHDARARRNEYEEAVQEAEAALAAIKEKIAEAEQKLRALRQEREEAMRKESQREVRLAEVKTRLEDLVESIREDFEYNLPESPPLAEEDLDEDAARREVADLRKKLRRLGSVNPLALEEYEEEKERLDFLTQQREDLEQAEETLLETIHEINATAAERFDETFEAIKKSFARLFERLFGAGASATLQLEDESDPLESTIEIVAQPRGKKPSILAQLSSGEKALTAIALLFAIYLVKPSPFCILDEVDAPLDDANTGRFMNLIREFEDDTQFILVTHNKRTMELADRMYGVTMQEQGVSKLVGVEFEEAVQMAEAA